MDKNDENLMTLHEELEVTNYFLDPIFHNEQLLRLQHEELNCLLLLNSTTLPSEGVFCPPVWDGAYCWPYSTAGSLVSVPCPSYIHGFDTNEHATKTCMSDGTWWKNESFNGTTWTNYSLCGTVTEHHFEHSSYEYHVPVIKHISRMGYSLSLSMLLVAFLILASIKKLRCPRNSLHMQLFLSFIMRAFLSLLKDVLFFQGLGVGVDSNDFFSSSSFLSQSATNNLDCKIFVSFWNYFIMANYCWILMEGLYLHNLVFLSVFSDTSGILKYIIFGWGLPILLIIPWIIVKATLENSLCWTIHKNPKYFWILRGPITASILLNFLFFLNISRVLFLKMFSTEAIQSRRYRYRKWFKSTLVLVPLFGVHYAILLSFSFSAGINETVELAWLYIDQTFSSFQGSFVALLYCFLNGEVQGELRKLKQKFLVETGQPLRSHHSLLTQSLTYLSRARSSVQSLHSTGDRKDNFRSNSPSPAAIPNDKFAPLYHSLSKPYLAEYPIPELSQENSSPVPTDHHKGPNGVTEKIQGICKEDAETPLLFNMKSLNAENQSANSKINNLESKL